MSLNIDGLDYCFFQHSEKVDAMKRNLDRQLRHMMLLGALVAMLLAGTSQAAVVGWWAMDDANYPPGYFDPAPAPTTADSSVNGNTGTLLGTSTTGATLGYDGSNYCATIGSGGAIDCGADSTLKSETGYTFATWVNFNDLASWQVIGSDLNDAGQPFYQFNLVSGKPYLALANTSGYYLFSNFGTEMITANTWVHLAFTLTPDSGVGGTDELTVYRDGNVIGTAAYDDTTLPLTTNSILLGARWNGATPTAQLHGKLDETGIWRSALSSGDIASLAGGASPETISASTLGGAWKFENVANSPSLGPTATVTDSLGIGQDGTMTPNGVDPFHPSGGRFDGAVELSGGEDYIVTDDIDGLTEEVTISTWIKPVDTAMRVVNSQWNDGNAADKAWQILMAGGTANLWLTNPEGGIYAPIGISDIPVDEWTHLVFTLKANDGETTGKVEAYKNGVKVGEVAYDMDELIDSSSPFVIGNRANPYAPQNFNGLVDDTAIFDEALSASQIAQLYSGGVGSIPEPSTILMIFCGLATLVCVRRR